MVREHHSLEVNMELFAGCGIRPMLKHYAGQEGLRSHADMLRVLRDWRPYSQAYCVHVTNSLCIYSQVHFVADISDHYS